MKKTTIAFLTAVTLLMGSSLAVAKKNVNHASLAAKYEKLAQEQRSVIKEHSKMKSDYKKDLASLPKQTREQKVASMEKHCNTIIEAAKKLEGEYKDLAKWHKAAGKD